MPIRIGQAQAPGRQRTPARPVVSPAGLAIRYMPGTLGKTPVGSSAARADIALLQPVGAMLGRTYALPQVRYEPPTSREVALMQRVLEGDIGPDSTTFEALHRNLRRWPNAVIVCDLTTSMDPYAAQVYAWFRRNTRQPNVLGTLFFTDCDSLGHETQPGGLPGAFFVTTERNPQAALPTILAAARNTTNNRLDDENVVEALRHAQRRFPAARHLVLLADNSNGAKDLALLPGITKPVHVIACGQTLAGQQPFHADHYQIATHTNGSLHTLEDDLTQLAAIRHNTFVRVGPTYFRYVARRGRFVRTRFTHRPTRFLGINW
jgi:hypothetical protein